MKIIVLYGPGEVQKRAEALKIRRQFATDAINIVDAEEEKPGRLEAVLVSSSLFEAPQRLVVLENAPERLDLAALPKFPDATTLLVLAGPLKVTSTLLKTAQSLQAKLLSFEGERELSAFPFVDALMEQRKQALTELEKLLAGYGGMYVLAMIYYGLRRNILPLPSSPFARKKIESQKRRFPPGAWEKLYRLVLATEFDIKSGRVPEELGLTILTQKIIGG